MSESVTSPPALPFEEPERWLAVVGWEGLYEVSDLGRVRSLPRLGVQLRKVYGGKILRQSLRSGYPSVTLYSLGKDASRTVHSLVLEAFVGPRPAGQVCRHGPLGKLDNRLASIRWGTRAENEADKVRDGTASGACGEDVPTAQLTAAIVLECRRRYAAGETQSALAQEFGVGLVGMHSAIRGRTWSWLPSAIPPMRQANLTWEIVAECRLRHAAGETQAALAREFGTARKTMVNAINGKTWMSKPAVMQ